ncbi:hypothetical protein RSAG8_03282, partial [Rhizoctonia solani AG-8 WAC10335]
MIRYMKLQEKRSSDRTCQVKYNREDYISGEQVVGVGFIYVSSWISLEQFSLIIRSPPRLPFPTWMIWFHSLRRRFQNPFGWIGVSGVGNDAREEPEGPSLRDRGDVLVVTGVRGGGPSSDGDLLSDDKAAAGSCSNSTSRVQGGMGANPILWFISGDSLTSGVTNSSVSSL